MIDILQYAVQGIPTGCVFALLAVGLVLTYKASGVFNLAFAAQAYVSAAVFYTVRKELEWPLLPAVLLAVAVVGPLLGLVLYRFLFRHLRNASSGAKLIASLGLLVALPELVKLVFGSDSKKNPPPLWWVERSDQWLWPEGSRFVLDAGQIATIVAAVVVLGGFTIVFRTTIAGLRMRAVVESPRMAQLNGVNSSRVAAGAWVMSSILAALSGVLLAPLFAALNSLDFFTLLVAALAAAVFARLTSIPLAFLGGVLLGVLQAMLAGALPTDSILSTGLRPSLPFAVLFLLLLLRPGLAKVRDVADPLSGVDPPPSLGTAHHATPSFQRWTRVALGALVVVLLYLGWSVLSPFWLGLVISGLVFGVILMSITVMTGLGGMVSLCQPTFAAIGAFTTAQLVHHFDMSVLVAAAIGTCIAAAIGALFALPVMRLDGVYLTLATLAFALMFQSVLVPLDWVGGGVVPLSVPRPLIGPVDLAENRAYFVFVVICMVAVAAIVSMVKRGRAGLYLDALRGSEDAATSIGISARRWRVTAFGASAAIAGFGGALLAMYLTSANFDQSYQYFVGLVWVVLIATMGARSVPTAVVAGLLYFLMPQLLERLFSRPEEFAASHTGFLASLAGLVDPSWAIGVSFVLFGLGAINYARHPEGVIEALGVRLASLSARRGAGEPSDRARAAIGADTHTDTPTEAVVVGAGSARVDSEPQP